MKSRGRVSAAALAVVSSAAIEAHERPGPPSELRGEERFEWMTVVNRMPADWFPPETHGLLVQYCRHRVAARRVSQLIEAAEAGDEIDVDEYDRLLRMQEREGRAMSALSTRMRLSQQSTYDKSRRKPTPGKRPWDV